MLDLVIYTEGLPFDGRTPFEKSLGGSESAVVFMARELARRGHRVRVFCPCPRPDDYDGVAYRDLTDFPAFVESGSCDVFISPNRAAEVLLDHPRVRRWLESQPLDDQRKIREAAPLVVAAILASLD